MAEERLRGLFPAIRFSSSLRSPAYGMPEGTADYVNAVAICDTILPYEELIQQLKALERQQGRSPELKSKGIVTLDIDVLQYGTKKYKPADWQRDFNIQLLNELEL